MPGHDRLKDQCRIFEREQIDLDALPHLNKLHPKELGLQHPRLLLEKMTTHRKLAALLAADVAGYSRLMADDEAATLRSLNDARALFREHIEAHGGRLIDTAGDSILAEFPSPVEAVDCATDIQRGLAKRNAQLAEHRRMRFRIGVNLGDVIEQEDETIYGDGVNIAARLQELAEPGGLCISGTVFDQIEGKLPLAFKFIGEQTVKNIPKPVRAYRALMDQSNRKPSLSRNRLHFAIGVLALVALIGAGITWKILAPESKAPSTSVDASLAMPTGPTVAVLPFTNMSGNREEDYFSDGLTEDIITELARFRELHVLARNTTFQFKGKAVDIPEIGRKLKARYVIEGSVRRSGDRIRITAQLIDATTGTHLWAERYDRELNEVFAIQDEITGRVVGAVAGGPAGAVLSAERSTAQRKPPGEMRAYDLVLRAVDKPSYEAKEYPKRKALLEEAIGVDPGYARALHQYAWTLLNGWIFRHETTSTPSEEILRNAIKAVELDPTDAYAHRTAAYGYFFAHQLDLFERETRIALELAPYNPEILAELGMGIAFIGQWERGTALVKKAHTLNAASAGGWYHTAIFYDLYQRGQYREAIDVIRQHPTQSLCETQLKYVAVYGQLGDRAKAKEHFDHCAGTTPGFSADFAQDILRLWNFEESFISKFMEGFAKAGYPLSR